MQAKYLAAYALHGITELPDGNDVELLAAPHLRTTVLLTGRPDGHCIHLDRYTALATQLVTSKQGRTYREDIDTLILSIKAARNKQGAGVFLIVKGEAEIGELDLTHCDDHPDFIVCENVFSLTTFRHRFEAMANGTLAAVGLSLAPLRSRSVTPIGEVMYTIDPASEKPIYSINIEMVTTVSTAGPLDEHTLGRIRVDAERLLKTSRLTNTLRLLVQCNERKDDDLAAFIEVWAALEIFVRGRFKDHYEQEWLAKLRTGTTPASSEDYSWLSIKLFNRNCELSDKFNVVSVLLDQQSCDVDIDKFKAIKEIRDTIHNGDITNTDLPTEDVQQILLKYIRLHLDYCAPRETSTRGRSAGRGSGPVPRVRSKL